MFNEKMYRVNLFKVALVTAHAHSLTSASREPHTIELLVFVDWLFLLEGGALLERPY